MHGGAESGGEMGRCMEELKAGGGGDGEMHGGAESGGGGGRWGDAWRS